MSAARTGKRTQSRESARGHNGFAFKEIKYSQSKHQPYGDRMGFLVLRSRASQGMVGRVLNLNTCRLSIQRASPQPRPEYDQAQFLRVHY